MADKCIGKLYLDISQVKKDIDEVNEFLSKIGANINLEDKLSKSIGKALNNLVAEAKKAGSEAEKALKNAVNLDTKGGIESTMQRVTTTVNTYVREVDKAGNATGKLVGTVQTGFDAAGNKIKEFADSTGAITKRTEEVKNSVEEQIDAMWKLHDAEEQAYSKQGEAAVQAGLKREEAARKAAQAEQERSAREVATMENDLARKEAAEDAALERKISADAAAQEKLRQQSIETEFAREEARKKEAAAEEDLIHKEVAAMEEAIEQEKAVLDKQVQAYEEAEEKKRQASINAEFAREEARQRAAQEEEDLIQREIAAMEESIQKQQEAAQKQFETDQINRAKQAYFELTDAIKNYNTAKNDKDSDGMATAQKRIDAAMQEVNAIREVVNASDMEANAKQQVLNYLQQCVTAEHQHGVEVKNTAKSTGELESQVTGLLTRYISLTAAIRAINGLIQNTVEYVSEYSDKMNEIQMITMKTDDEISQLASTYRNIAADMSVSSLDMADAAIYFTRQGLAAEEIEKRLKNVTMYAKAANVEFKDASEIITSVVNSMGLVAQQAEDGRNATQRVADVFLNIGDNAATSGQEIGEAMQKAAASAGAFGVSMEWLAAYIATVSETTRQEARTIGTAFNTIIARLHQIKQTGYNQEDETRVNDIAKALSKIDVVLMDQEGNWRDMETILEEVADKWGGLDGKTRSYIATTMAGVKQQNVFLALMNDMSKGVENGSRAFELHEKAINSDGVAAEKYAVYLDSVTASQERLTVAQENFYSLLDDDVIKTWNNTLADVVNSISEAAEQTDGLTLILPVAIGLISAFAIAITHAGGASALFASIWEKHPVLLAISAAVAAVAGLTLIVSEIISAAETAEEKMSRLNKTIEESSSNVKSLQSTRDEFNQLFEKIQSGAELTSSELARYNSLLDEIAELSPGAKAGVDHLRDSLYDQKTAAQETNDELERMIKNQQTITAHALAEKYSNMNPSSKSKANDLAVAMSNWDEDWANGGTSESGRFASSLYNAFASASGVSTRKMQSMIDSYNYGDFRRVNHKVLSQEIYDEIKNKLEEYKNLDIDTAELWRSIGNYIWGKYADTADMKESTELMMDVINGSVDEVLAGVGQHLDAVQTQAFRNQIMKAILGDDNQLSEEEYASYGDRIAEIVLKAAANGFDPEKIISDGELQAARKELTDGLIDSIMDFSGVEALTGGMWMKLDLSTLEQIDTMLKTTGVTIQDIEKIMAESSSVDEFTNKLKELGKTLEESGGEEGKPKSLKELTKEVNDSVKDIKALDAAIKSIQKDPQNINYSDILGLAEAHPELLTVIGDTDALLKKLKEVKAESKNQQRDSLRNMILSNEKTMAGSKYADSGFATLKDYRDSLTDEAAIAEFDAEIEKMIDGWQKANEDAKKAAKESKEEAKDAKKAFSDTVKEVESLDKTIEKLQSKKKVDFSDLVDLSTAHPEIMAFAGDADKLIEILQRLKAQAETNVKNNLKDYMLDSEDYFKESEHYDPRFKNMREYITDLRDSRDAKENWKDVADEVDNAAQNIVDAAKETKDAAESWLEAQAKIAEINEEVNWAKSNNFEDQINALQGAIESGGIESAIELFESWTDEMQKAVASEYPALIKIMGNTKKAMKEQGDQTEVLTKQTKEMKATLASTEKLNNVKYFTDTAEAIKKLSNGTISATDAIEVYHKEVNKVTKAYEDILDVQNKMEYNDKEANKDNPQKIDAADVSNLANLLNMTTEQVLADFPAAVDMFDQLTSSTGELTDMLNQLSAASFIKITGTSEADFTNLQNGLISIQGMAKETIEQLEKTGLWTVETIKLDTEAWVQNADGTWTSKYLQGYQEILKPTSNNPLSGRTGGTGVKDNSTNNRRSGGGGSSKDKNKNSMTEVERALDVMSQVNTIQEGQQGYYQSQQKYYQQTGQLQGVIAYMQRENDVLKNQNVTLEGNIQRIEAYMEKKRAELATLSITDEAYEEVADDLDKLQKAHQTYTKQLVDNRTAMDALTKSIKEQNDKIRQMEIDLRNTILKAIEDRERRTEDMMNAEIEMENKILDLITRRYERERDEIIETTNKRIDLLNEEKNLLSEQLQMRKEQADEEDKLTKLKELEVKYQRIVADPTRRKEALSIRKDIDDLRKEMAWDAAEKEVKAQQDALDKQITNLEDYITYVEEYYEDLFEHPVKLIEEMKSILEKSDAEIIEWLKTNEEEYARSTENTQAKMVSGWQDTLDAMRGLIKTYWDEVEQIVSQGDEYIIEFLKANSKDYREAGKLQAEAYVDQWKEQLENLKKAHQQVAADIAASYDVIQKSETSASSKSSGGGGGGGGSKKSSQTEDHGYSFVYGGKTYAQNGFSTKDVADAAMKDAVSNIVRMSASAGGMSSSSMIGQGIKLIQSQATVYKDGGLADFTGPAWLDGTKQDPERILNPYQTKLFESMVQALERMSTISIPGMPDFGGMAAGGNPVSVGDIVVNVENLDTDDDYEELAQKVSEILMDRIGRTAVVGGMRISSF